MRLPGPSFLAVWLLAGCSASYAVLPQHAAPSNVVSSATLVKASFRITIPRNA